MRINALEWRLAGHTSPPLRYCYVSANGIWRWRWRWLQICARHVKAQIVGEKVVIAGIDVGFKFCRGIASWDQQRIMVLSACFILFPKKTNFQVAILAISSGALMDGRSKFVIVIAGPLMNVEQESGHPEQRNHDADLQVPPVKGTTQ